jgi:hypothetical protein
VFVCMQRLSPHRQCRSAGGEGRPFVGARPARPRPTRLQLEACMQGRRRPTGEKGQTARSATSDRTRSRQVGRASARPSWCPSATDMPFSHGMHFTGDGASWAAPWTVLHGRATVIVHPT